MIDITKGKKVTVFQTLREDFLKKIRRGGIRMNRNRLNTVKEKHEQGFVLVIAVILMGFLLVLALPFMAQLSVENKLTDKSFKSCAALSLAEAGVERAVWELNFGDITTWNGDAALRTMTITSFQAPSGNVVGDIEIKVHNPETKTPLVEATGILSYSDSALMAKAARVELEVVKYDPWNFAVFGDEDVDFSSNAEVDSYDSGDGAYGGANVGSEGDVGTNGTLLGCIDLCSNSKIYGDAVTGPGSDPESVIITQGSAYIDGEKKSLGEEKKMPSVALPEVLTFMGGYNLGVGDVGTIDASGEYTSFILASNSTVTITSDVILYITGDFTMSSNTQLNIDNGASVTIYLGGTFSQSSNSQINNLSQDPTKLLILGTDTFSGTMTWNSNTDFYGAVYAPRAHVDFRSNIDFYGSIIANTFEFNSNARFHYDRALAGLKRDDMEGMPYGVRSWQEELAPVFIEK